MDARDYTDRLMPVLAAGTAEASKRIERLRRAADRNGSGIEGILIEVFVDQDGEGPFDVWARFEGDAASAADRAAGDDRHLFGVEWGEEGWEPEVPGRPRGWSRDDLERAALAAVTDWLSPLLPPGPPEDFWWIGTPDGATA